MLKIGEFSQLGHVSIRMLRHYDDIGLLRPKKIDQESGYRYYSVRQLGQLHTILLLKELKFSLQEIKELLSAESIVLKKQLLSKQMEIEAEIAQDQLRIEAIQRKVDQIDKPVSYPIRLCGIPDFPVIGLRKVIPSFYHEGQLWRDFYDEMAQQKLAAALEDMGSTTIFYDQEYKEQNNDIEIVLKTKEIVPVSSPLVSYVMPKIPLAASIIVKGNYHQLPIVYQSFACWLDQHPEYQMIKTTRQVCHIGPDETEDSEEYITELQIPLIALDSHTT
ncbi:MerR family transcriptional regulator [Candidatus Enterococcus ferrettii]|uniref:HTH merR-type domain-containing protein n=1 Tax=Candidatus Enterococcus ferrettii TaxID=2815324 RepID=A0ABV0ETQ2_9ENTE|nr:MerR family transcriptional regulator [Enterococcus sp. 665A]MBO1343099.1 MerR family transcriptional regulator [Enterococcus sp. 665A]